MITLSVPTPPSSNHRLIVARGRAVLAPEHRRWMAEAVRTIAAQLPRGWQPITGPVLLIADVQVPGLSSDVSNRLKSLEDALTEAGVWLDDRQVAEIQARKSFGLESCEARLSILPTDAPHLAKRLFEAEKRAAKTRKPRKLKGVTATPNVRRGA